MTPSEINALAEDVPDSMMTQAGQTLFFANNASGIQNLRKLKNHFFKVGYTFEIKSESQTFTRLFAYNHKNDIVAAWLTTTEKETGEMEVKFPYIASGFSGRLRAIRTPKQEHTWTRIDENFSDLKRGTFITTPKFEPTVPHIPVIKDLKLFGRCGLIIPEHPSIDQYRYENVLRSRENNNGKGPEFYPDVSRLCNVYVFDKTFELLDEGLKGIYGHLRDHHLERFCTEVTENFENQDIIEAMLKTLKLDQQDLKEVFDECGYNYPKSKSQVKPDAPESSFKGFARFFTSQSSKIRDSEKGRQIEKTRH